MKRTKIGSNMSEMQLGLNSRILFSYETPVAGYHPEKGWFRTDAWYSQTTTRHINKYLSGRGNAETVTQDWINQLVREF